MALEISKDQKIPPPVKDTVEYFLVKLVMKKAIWWWNLLLIR